MPLVCVGTVGGVKRYLIYDCFIGVISFNWAAEKIANDPLSFGWNSNETALCIYKYFTCFERIFLD